MGGGEGEDVEEGEEEETRDSAEEGDSKVGEGEGVSGTVADSVDSTVEGESEEDCTDHSF